MKVSPVMEPTTDLPNTNAPPATDPSRARRRPRFGVGTRLLIMAALLGGVWLATTVMGQPAFEWRASFEVARAEATERDVPILLDFWGTYCPPCRMLDIRLFADDQVAAAISETCVPYKVDVAKASPGSTTATLAAKYNVRFTPTVILVDATSLEIIATATTEDLADINAFKRFLQR